MLYKLNKFFLIQSKYSLYQIALSVRLSLIKLKSNGGQRQKDYPINMFTLFVDDLVDKSEPELETD